MRRKPAQYLLRIDDLCPTVSAERWARWQALIEEFRLKPILAVVPDNQDAELQVSPPDPAFWERMRDLEAAGASIALHGYRHLCGSRGRSLVNLHRTTEFAGVPGETQRAWIAEALRILHSHGLNPTVWVAPRHGFDTETIFALRGQGIAILSDGFASVPFVRDSVTWIPQQLWGPVKKAHGLWTICIHPNTASDAEIESMRSFLATHAAQFTQAARAIADFQPTTLTLFERIHAVCALRRFKLSRVVRRILRPANLRSSRPV